MTVKAWDRMKVGTKRYSLRLALHCRREEKAQKARFAALYATVYPTPQEVWDKAYNGAYDKAWADHAAGRITADEAIERTTRAWQKAEATLARQTGYA